jgi:carboxypeptidase family protein
MITSSRRQALLASAVVLGCILLARPASAQQPPPPPPPTEPVAAPPESSAPPAPKNSRIPTGFLIHGTVFDHQALALAGAELRVRRSGEKKFHWQTAANSRGEFAMRVPPGNDYEVVVQAKGFADSTQAVDAKNGLSEASLVIRMAEAHGKKK